MALTADRLTPQMGTEPIPSVLSLPVAASTLIYAGALVAVNASGYAVPASTPAAGAAHLQVVGRAEKQADNSAGSAGAISVTVQQGVFRWKNSSSTNAIVAADVGRDCFAVDDETVARTSNLGARSHAGRVMLVDSSGVWVETRMGMTPQDDELEVLAGADLSAKQFYLIKLNSSGEAVLAGAGEAAIGVLMNAPASGAVARVRVWGKCKAIASAAIAKGALVASDSAGKLKAAVLGKTDTSDSGASADALIGSHVLGITLQSSSADGDVIEIRIIHAGAVPTTAA